MTGQASWCPPPLLDVRRLRWTSGSFCGSGLSACFFWPLSPCGACSDCSFGSRSGGSIAAGPWPTRRWPRRASIRSTTFAGDSFWPPRHALAAGLFFYALAQLLGVGVVVLAGIPLAGQRVDELRGHAQRLGLLLGAP